MLKNEGESTDIYRLWKEYSRIETSVLISEEGIC